LLPRTYGAGDLPVQLRRSHALRLPFHHHAQPATLILIPGLQQATTVNPGFSRRASTFDAVLDDVSPASASAMECRTDRARTSKTDGAPQFSDRLLRLGFRLWGIG